MKRRKRKNPSELVSFALVATGVIAALYIFKRIGVANASPTQPASLELDAANRWV